MLAPDLSTELARFAIGFDHRDRRRLHDLWDGVLDSERWSEGEYLGWFVEHDGYRYGGLDKDYGQDGPHPTHAAALTCMAEHLRRATEEAKEDDDWGEGAR